MSKYGSWRADKQAYQHTWYLAHKEIIIARAKVRQQSLPLTTRRSMSRRYYYTHQKQEAQRKKEARLSMTEEQRLKERQKYWKNPVKEKERKASARQREKLASIQAFGGRCVCCREENLVFLAIDHINGGGGRHRRQIGSANFYRWLRFNNYPAGFQVLCLNCNWAKDHGGCPHKQGEGSS